MASHVPPDGERTPSTPGTTGPDLLDPAAARSSLFLPVGFEALAVRDTEALAGYVAGVASRLRRWRAEGIGDGTALSALERQAEQALRVLREDGAEAPAVG